MSVTVSELMESVQASGERSRALNTEQKIIVDELSVLLAKRVKLGPLMPHTLVVAITQRIAEALADAIPDQAKPLAFWAMEFLVARLSGRGIEVPAE